jgi:hypothetical protein
MLYGTIWFIGGVVMFDNALYIKIGYEIEDKRVIELECVLIESTLIYIFFIFFI